MSLAQYWALGKSIRRADTPSRYQVVEMPLAPSFGAKPAADVMEAREARENQGEPSATLFEQARKSGEVVVIATPPAAPAAREERPARLGRWFLGRRRPPREQVAVQRELALQMVRPVRNDLLETDLEVRPAPGAAAAGGAGVGDETKTRGAFWARCWRKVREWWE